MPKINIDALIPREDFEISGNKTTSSQIPALSITDLSSNFLYPTLRKPDFQRETNEWDAKKICELIHSFIEGDLIPSIILWRSETGLVFVIDGAHRLSALISWIHDDYGDGKISSKFYDNKIPEDQKELAQKARTMINKKIGSYADICKTSDDNEAPPEYLTRRNNIGVHSIHVQWVPGNAKNAEKSFFNINQKASKIHPTELKLLESRKKPNCIAARAIIRAGKGHKYWSNFSAEIQEQIQNIAEEINTIFFSPQLKTPVKTMDIPIGGKISSAQTLPLILEFVNMANNIPEKFKDMLNDDLDGTSTLNFLKKARKMAWRINSVHPSSLGLHPIVYFYSSEGKFKTASFYAVTHFVLELIKRDKLKDFTQVREEFEDFLMRYDYITQQINRKYRSALKSLPHVSKFYFAIIENIKSGCDYREAIQKVIAQDNYNFIVMQTEPEDSGRVSKNFSSESKSAVFIKEALQKGLRCKICGGFIHTNSITIDHIDRKEDGGLGVPDNGQLAHPYCNTTFKN